MEVKHTVDVRSEVAADALDMTVLKVAALATLKYCDVQEVCEMVVVISNDQALKALNQRFRGEAHPTDVLSFPDDTRGPFTGAVAGFPRYLGDIVISIDRARAQAEEVGVALIQELQLLIVHGTLHLLGYDHVEPGEKEQMWAEQAKILSLLDIAIPLPE